MAQPAKEELLCPRCRVPMVQAVGVPGVWQCPKREDHEFMEDPPTTKTADSSRAKKPKEPREAPRRCPRCGAKAKKDDLGWYCDSGSHRGIYRLPAEDEPYWLAHLGLPGPLQGVRQSSSSLDGTLCQPIGDLKRGGTKTGRKRRKPRKWVRGPKEFFEV